jgi:hypothetical protein
MIQNILDEVPHAPPPRPPSPAPRDPPHRRVVVNIEIVPMQHPRTTPRSGRWALAVLIWLVVLLMIGAAHSQPTQWQIYRQGFTDYGRGTDQNGGTWQSQSYRQGFTTYTDIQGPHGQTQHCQTTKRGFEIVTECY